MRAGTLLLTIDVLRIARCFLHTPPTKPVHGWALAKAYGIPEKRTYENLIKLEDAGWIASRVEPGEAMDIGRTPRRLYAMTQYGREQATAAWALLASTST